MKPTIHPIIETNPVAGLETRPGAVGFRHYALYLRVSTTDQTTDPQELELKEFATRRGFAPIEVYRDFGISGSKTSRPSLDRMLQNARAGEILGVLAAKLDRLGRSLQHMVSLTAELARLEVPIHIPAQGIDTSTSSPFGKFQIAMLAALAEFEREIIRERVVAGIKSAKAKGVHCGRKPIDPALIEKARPLVLQGALLRVMAAELGISIGKAHYIKAAILKGTAT